ncbi:YncE family protein [Pseudonocardiaceae bacterium YIM PH 21723]|nr:YncE family protein [Pseudonocardiaceae bacterium YIM PH 21723]
MLKLVVGIAMVMSTLTAPATAMPPGCQGTAPAQPVLGDVRSENIDLPAAPFAVAYTPRGDTAFVTLGNAVGVLSGGSVRRVPLPTEAAAGLAVTHDGQRLIVAAGTGALVLDTARTIAGSPDAVLGTLTGDGGDQAIQVLISADDRYAFVSQEYGTPQTGDRGGIQVFDLRSSAFVGHLPLGRLVVGTALSTDGRTLYATSQRDADNGPAGVLSTIDVATLQTTPADALRTNVPAGCEPVRVAVAPDGKTVWVTARGSNALLAFDAATTELLTSVQVGTAPVGLSFARGGTRILTADSNRRNSPGASTGLTVIDVRAGRSLGRIPTGVFPREMAQSPDGKTVLTTVFGSNRLQAVDTATLP